jgi:hypothetical protein
MSRFIISGLFLLLFQNIVLANEPNTISGLKQVEFENLPLSAIKPKGWLLGQLRIQAAGLSGHLDEFWPDVAQSGWIGGKAEGWERGPYWLDGIIPLAWSLNDKTHKNKANRWMNYIIEHQQPHGWLGPVRARERQAYDPWAELHYPQGDDTVLRGDRGQACNPSYGKIPAQARYRSR